MFRKKIIGLAFCGLMATSVFAADIIVRTAPPRGRVEHRGRAPVRGQVWIPGYQRWDNNAYVWVPGRWDTPPRPRARWVAPRWQHRRDGYVFIEGRWR